MFKPHVAYSINAILLHLVAYFGAFVFCGLFKNLNNTSKILLALCFASINFWPSGAFAVAGQPWLLWGFYNIYKNNKGLKYWMPIVIIPFNSILIFSNLFLIPLLFLSFSYLSFKNKEIKWNVIMAFILFILLSIIAEHRLFETVLLNKFESHRFSNASNSSLNFFGWIGTSIKHFLKGQYHFYTIFCPIVLLLVLIFMNNFNRKQKINLFLLIGLIFSISLIYILPNWNVFQKLLGIRATGVSLRFYSIQPMLIFTLLIITINYASGVVNEIKRKLVLIILSLLIVYNLFPINKSDYAGSEFVEAPFYKTYFKNNINENSSFDNYYNSKKIIALLAKLDSSKYILCNGVAAEILQFHNYKTIDGYFYLYPKTYGEWFKQISDTINQSYQIDNHVKLPMFKMDNGIEEFPVDLQELKNKNCNQIISTQKLNIPNNLCEFDSTKPPNKLYYYKIK